MASLPRECHRSLCRSLPSQLGSVESDRRLSNDVVALSTDAYQKRERRHLATSTDLSILRAIRFSLNFAFWVENLHSHLIGRPIRGQFPRVYPLRRVEHAHREILNAHRFHFVPRVLFVRQCVKNRFEGLQRGWEGFPGRARHDGSCLVRKDEAVRGWGDA